MAQKVLKVGSSAGITIPKDILKELGVRIGDSITLSFHKGKNVVIIESDKEMSKEDKRIARLTLNFINRYRRDLQALAQK